MTHSSGIVATNELKNVISKAKSGHVRLIKMIIASESLTLDTIVKPSKSWQNDFDSSILPCLKTDQSCYLLYRLDSRHNDGNPEWILITYVPETTPTRQKMIYASTKITMKKSISNLHIKHEISATTTQECTLEGYEQYLRSLNAPKPLTQAEKELEMIRQNEDEMRNQSKRQTLKSVSFPLTPELTEALTFFKKGQKNYLQIAIDIAKEVISLVTAERIDIDELRLAIPTDKPRYNLYSFVLPNRTQCAVFIHSIPIGNSSIKEKMLYSTCKIPFLQHMETEMGIVVSKKIETDTPEEITQEYLVDQVTAPSGTPHSGINPKNLPVFRTYGNPAYH